MVRVDRRKKKSGGRKLSDRRDRKTLPPVARPDDRTCSFCEKSIPNELFLVRGRNGAAICGKCVTTAARAIMENEAELRRETAASRELVDKLEKSLAQGKS